MVDILRQIYKKCGKEDLTSLLLITGVLSQILSSAAFIASIMTNDELPKKQKGFLSTQEVIEGGMAIGFTCFLTKGMRQLGEKLIKNNLVLPDLVKKESYKFEETEKKVFKEQFLELSSFAGTVAAAAVITPIVKNVISTGIYKYKEKKEKVHLENQKIANFDTLKRRTIPINKYITQINSPSGMKI